MASDALENVNTTELAIPGLTKREELTRMVFLKMLSDGNVPIHQ